MDSETRRCAVVDANNLAINLIIADSMTIPPDGCQLIDLQPNQLFDIGWTWTGIEFVNPTDTGGNP